MVLVDTSVWIGHLRKRQPDLVELLDRSLVLIHPFALGELACGGLRDHPEFLRHFGSLPAVPSASHGETLHLLETRELWGGASAGSMPILSHPLYWAIAGLDAR